MTNKSTYLEVTRLTFLFVGNWKSDMKKLNKDYINERQILTNNALKAIG